MTLRARAETFGAWVRVDDRTLLAVDRALASKLGVEGSDRWREPPPSTIADATTRPLEVHVAVTSKCPATCDGCYLDAGPHGAHRAVEAILATLDAVADAGAFTVAFGGGEPLTHPELPRVAAHARARGLVPVVTTSGIGLGPERARALRDFAQVNVSHDGVGGAYEAVRGFDGASVAERAIAALVEASIPVGVNLVLTRESFGDDGAALLATCARIAALGAREIQLLRWKPAGRATSLDYLARRLGSAQVAALPAVIRRIVEAGALSVRIDCALVPLLSTALDRVEDLLALGIMGCEAGRGLAAVDVSGRVAPCSFLEGASSADAFEHALDDPRIAAVRAHADAPPAPCATCPLRPVCRGGCRVVAAHVCGDARAPDPECPRVIAAREAST